MAAAAGANPLNQTGADIVLHPAAQAEAECRALLSANLQGARLQVAVGQLTGLSGWWVSLKERGCWLEPVCKDPA